MLEDSGLVLGAEAPLRVWFGVHDPGDAGMGLGIWLHVGRFQLPRKKGSQVERTPAPGATGPRCPSPSAPPWASLMSG